MQSIILLTAIILAVHIDYLFGLPLIEEENQIEIFKRLDDALLPDENFSLVTNEKLLKLKELADAAHDPKLHDLYRAVNHYVKMARKNKEYVLWRYDANQEGVILVLKQNLSGILYYG